MAIFTIKTQNESALPGLSFGEHSAEITAEQNNTYFTVQR